MEKFILNKLTELKDEQIVSFHVPGHKSGKIFKKLGYDNVEVICHGITEPAKTPVDTPYLLPVEKATRNVFGPYMVYPNRPSTAPDYLWTNILGLPTIQVRWCDATSDNHAPNEHLTLSNYIKGTELTATVLKEISEM